ncbi:hypothetical protein [Delftia tsuruhatensis]|uniref:hypothetical protein n=1 Tax=Delftia tsuruhatensis TaxID=180282 RepID=UPI002091AE82|nr:hypothetical protein [Delftia tsuruhatensis]MCO5338248.1 hypothetical protein [Delftia tsuruhatensis]MCR4545646.1 hypothetical protein [Delftia tsuruhatensis]
MAQTDLIFSQQINGPGSPVDLIFGADDDQQPVVVLQASGRITGLRGRVRARSAVQANARGSITGLRAKLQAHANINVDRPIAGRTPTVYQEGAPASAPLRSTCQQAERAGQAVCVTGGHAVPIQAATRQHWQEAARLRQAVWARMQDARGVGLAVAQSWQDAGRVRAAVFSTLQDAQTICAAIAQAWQESIRLRGRQDSTFGHALPRGAAVASRMTDGLHTAIPWQGRYQEAMRPGPGSTPIRPVEPVDPPCYVPPNGLDVRLLFEQPWSSGTQLVFVCCKPGPEPEPPRFQIPLLKVYMTVHSMEAVLLPSMEPVALTDVSIASDDDGFAWSLSANGPGHLLEQLAPIGGIPVRIRVVVDGVDFVFVVQCLARTRRFGEHRVALQGVSTSALLGSPYMPEQTWLGNSPATAQQLLIQALEFTGVDLDWTIPDWLVPAGVWSHRGTPLSAVMRVAEAVGAVVRSHRTQDRLIVAPRFPVLPWNWPAAVPDVSMPAAVIATDDLRPEPRASYNAVYVSGQAGGILGHVLRAGSAGEQLAPQVTDALITDEIAARQRGAVVLAGAGNKLIQSITMPLVTGGSAPGLIQPGQLIEVADVGQTWRGLVRATRLSASMPVVRQQITVERAAT